MNNRDILEDLISNIPEEIRPYIYISVPEKFGEELLEDMRSVMTYAAGCTSETIAFPCTFMGVPVNNDGWKTLELKLRKNLNDEDILKVHKWELECFDEFMSELTRISKWHVSHVSGCGCCGSPYIPYLTFNVNYLEWENGTYKYELSFWIDVVKKYHGIEE